MPGAALLGVKFPLRLLATLVQWYELHHSLSLPSHYAIFGSPKHPYTQALLSAIPVPRIHNRGERILIKGEITSLVIHSVPQGNAPDPAFVHGRR